MPDVDSVLKHIRPGWAGVEIGVREGQSAAALLRHGVRFLYLVDPWRADPEYLEADPAGGHEDAYRQTVRRMADWPGRHKILRTTSEEAAALIPGPLDFVWVDGNHRYEFVRRDLELYWPLVRDGGVLCGHDYNNTGWAGDTAGPHPWMVRRAVDEFAAARGLAVRQEGESWVIEKPVRPAVMMNHYIGTVARMGGVPAVYGEFVDSFADLIQWNTQYLCHPGERVHYPRPPGVSIHDFARNRMVEGMRGDWLLMLDSDNSFEPDLTARLINVADATGADVVTGFYQYRSHPHSPVLYLDRDGTPTPLVDWDPGVTALDVVAAGAGCLWTRKSVFRRIRAELGEEPFARIGGMGEDHSFFQRVKKLGVKAVAAMKVECHHLQVRPLSAEHYDRGVFEASGPEPARGYR